MASKYKSLSVRWIYADGNEGVIDEESLQAAKAVILSEPENISAHLIIALYYLDKGLLISSTKSALKCNTHWLALSKKPVKSIDPTVKTVVEVDEVYIDGNNQISLSTLCLYVSVIYHALNNFRTISIRDMLPLTQEALRRATAEPTVK